MNHRRGEKIGWTGGWLGSFLWLLILGTIWVIQGRTTAGLAGLALFLVGSTLIFLLSPWRHPQTRYWKLILPLSISLITAAALFIRLSGGWRMNGLNPWQSALFLPLVLLPMLTLGRRTWQHGESAESE